MNLIRNLSLSGKTVIFSTHDLNIALRLTDRIWLMLRDRLIEGSPGELLKNGSFDSLFGPDEQGSGASFASDIQDYLKNFL
jgi:iron complex transport system ATP-binding protein